MGYSQFRGTGAELAATEVLLFWRFSLMSGALFVWYVAGIVCKPAPMVHPNASSAHRLAIVLSFASLSASNCVLCVASAIVWRRACKKIAEEAAQVAAVEEVDLSQLTLRVFTHHEHDVEQDHVELSPSEVCSVCLCEFHVGQDISSYCIKTSEAVGPQAPEGSNTVGTKVIPSRAH